MQIHDMTVTVTDRGPLKQTHSGRMIPLLDIQEQDIDIHDIAHHLAVMTRWTGASTEPINVAWHSLNAMNHARREYPGDYLIQLFVLLHDAPEYLVGDICRPMKVALEGLAPGILTKIEDDVLRVVLGAFGLRMPTEAEHAKIKVCDNYATAIEARYYLNPPEGVEDWRQHLPAADFVGIRCWTHDKANFIQEWRRLMTRLLPPFRSV